MTMTKVQGGNNLPKKSSCFLGSQASFLDEVIKQLATRDMLQDQVQIFSILVHIVQ